MLNKKQVTVGSLMLHTAINKQIKWNAHRINKQDSFTVGTVAKFLLFILCQFSFGDYNHVSRFFWSTCKPTYSLVNCESDWNQQVQGTYEAAMQVTSKYNLLSIHKTLTFIQVNAAPGRLEM